MKTRRLIYLILGLFLIVVNLLVDLLNYKELYLSSNDAAYTFGTIVGGHILMITGLFLLRASYQLNRKIKSIITNTLQIDIDSIGKPDE
jgi:hypothetical protein